MGPPGGQKSSILALWHSAHRDPPGRRHLAHRDRAEGAIWCTAPVRMGAEGNGTSNGTSITVPL